MAFNGSGIFNRVRDWTDDKANTVAVTASRMDEEDDGFATGLSLCILKDGQQTTTARIPFASGVSAAAGSVSGASYAQTNDVDTGMYFPATDQVAFTCAGGQVLALTATGATITGTLTPSGVLLAASGTVAAPGVSFSADTDCGLYRIGANNIGVAVNGAKVLDVGTAGLGITGTLSATSDVAINTNKFTVTASSGNTLVAGTLAVTGAATLSSTLAAGATTVTGALAASGDFAIATNKFTVASASGNTAVAGTLAVTGASTLTGALSANNAAGVTAKNTAKAFGNATISGTTLTTTDSFGVTSITRAGVGLYDVVIPDRGDANYIVIANVQRTGGVAQIPVLSSKVGTGFRITAVTPATGTQESEEVNFVIFDS